MEDAQAPFDQHAQLLRMLEMTARQRTERQAEVDRLQRAADDYEELRSTLHELPSKVEHKVLVPFGKMAFFPGSLRHTNEVLVLLGDNYFALRSAEQAAAIAARRAEFVRPKVADAQADVAELTTRIEQIRAFGATQDVREGEFEIREPYFSDDEGADGEEEEEGAQHPAFPLDEDEDEEGEEDEDEDEDEEDAAATSAAVAAYAEQVTAFDRANLAQPSVVASAKKVSFSEGATKEGTSGGSLAGVGGERAERGKSTAPGAPRGMMARACDSDDDSDTEGAEASIGLRALSASLPAAGARRSGVLGAGPAEASAAAGRRSHYAPVASRVPPVDVPSATAGSAFTARVVERPPERAAPTEMDILIREVAAQKSRLEQRRAWRADAGSSEVLGDGLGSGAVGSGMGGGVGDASMRLQSGMPTTREPTQGAESASVGAHQASEEEGEGRPRMSLFKQQRMRQPQG